MRRGGDYADDFARHARRIPPHRPLKSRPKWHIAIGAGSPVEDNTLAMNENLCLIYVQLLDEGTKVSRPVYARQLSANEYLLLGIKLSDGVGIVPETETWEFQPRDRVHCERLKDGAFVACALAKD